MVNHLNHNGRIVREDQAIISADNRSFRYGDGLFETMLVTDERIQLAAFHYDRLFDGIRLLQFSPPHFLTREFLTAQIMELVKKNRHGKYARVRLMIFRGNGGLHDVVSHIPNYIIQTAKLPPTDNKLSERGLSVDLFAEAIIAADRFSHLKSNNFLPYVMASLHARQQQLDDCFLLNTEGNVCDASIANVFIIKNQRVFTPSLDQGCVGGVMRRYLLQHFSGHEPSWEECRISPQDLKNADEVFLTNAISGIRWVERCHDTFYRNAQTRDIYLSLLKDAR